jgi:hypothetical protein
LYDATGRVEKSVEVRFFCSPQFCLFITCPLRAQVARLPPFRAQEELLDEFGGGVFKDKMNAAKAERESLADAIVKTEQEKGSHSAGFEAWMRARVRRLVFGYFFLVFFWFGFLPPARPSPYPYPDP